MSAPRVRRARPLRFEGLESRLPLATFFVSPAGNDAQSGMADAPWQTLQTAANRVQAGDTVVVRAGNYVGFDLRRDGTAASPIVFRADPGAAITQRNPVTPDGINLEGADFITIDGFTVNGMPRAGIRAVENEHVTIRNNRLDQNQKWGIFTGFSDDLLIEGNIASRSVEQHGIYVSNSGDRPVIRNNSSWGNYANGIHMNGDASMGGDGIITGALVENNVLYENGRGGGSAINADGVQGSIFRNNLIYSTHASGISLYQIDGGGGSANNLVVSNTVLVAADGRWALNIVDGSTGNTVRNNILYNQHSFRGSINIDAASWPGFTSDYNAVMDRLTPNDGGTIQTLAQWQTTTGQDQHSLVATPAQLFVAPSTFDFHLLAGSPAIDAGTPNFAPATDLAGAARPSGGGFDIGAYEFQAIVTPPPQPPPTDPTQEAAAAYLFDEASGAIAADASGHGQAATYVNQPLLGQAGVTESSRAVTLNGVNQYVALPAAPFGNPASSDYALTFETWFRAAPGTGGVILSQTSSGATPGGAIPAGYVPVVHLGTDGKIRSTVFWHGDANARVVSPGATVYNDGLWHHVAVTTDGGVETLYLDGVVAGQQTQPQVAYASAYSYFLGTGQTSLWAGGNGGWQFFNGRLDNAAIYQRALAPAEVAQHFQEGKPTLIAAEYRLDETSGAVAADASGNGESATYVNQPLLGQPGVTGAAVTLNGVNQYVALPADLFGSTQPAAGEGLTFETWFRAAPGTSGVILSQTAAGATPGGGIPSGYVPVVHLGTDGRIRSTMFWHGSANARIVSPGAKIYNDGLWHHVAVTTIGGVETLYLDGVAVGQQTQPQVAYAAAYGYFLGVGQTSLWEGGNGGWQFFSGQLANATFYRRALSAAEIAAHVTVV